MTKSIGAITLAAPCCGARYAYPRYTSMNFMAWAYWTDGWRDDSLMPNDEGLRRCTCGQFFLLKDTKAIEEGDDAEGVDMPFTMTVPDEQLPECFSRPVTAEVEVAARLVYWRYLNHDYRSAYVEHRDAEEAATQAAWIAQNPDRRTWWDRLLRRPAPPLQQAQGQPLHLSALRTHPGAVGEHGAPVRAVAAIRACAVWKYVGAGRALPRG